MTASVMSDGKMHSARGSPQRRTMTDVPSSATPKLSRLVAWPKRPISAAKLSAPLSVWSKRARPSSLSS